ncbi:hypothetical protein pEaSNUABM30_00081 [Erwinia phage pEa_SNUABM_30]|uniref:Uncharacterized protein n=1 Tax=Erwinia phage pEa_SNUABM_30 TaxID=2869553 RepID=A0AAE8XLU6_9CAUD|nr:hypothetical protein MPK69_gp081 [Erwinia phage pEa_SNUABM_30]UAW53199.1 hypothetical protein pEaSNUABM30_00081 [Erwinia phage pEa_SNUABM_30]
MYISKAMLNMRGDVLGSSAAAVVDAPWLPSSVTAYNAANAMQAGGTHVSAEPAAAIVFSSGDAVPDTTWTNQAQALFSLNSLRTYLAANVPGCVMDTAYASTGTLRVVNAGNGKRMFDLNSLLGRFSYAKPFNRMYLFISQTTSTLAPATVSVATVVEFTAQDLIAMGASLTNNNDGTFNLNGTIILNNITFS